MAGASSAAAAAAVAASLTMPGAVWASGRCLPARLPACPTADGGEAGSGDPTDPLQADVKSLLTGTYPASSAQVCGAGAGAGRPAGGAGRPARGGREGTATDKHAHAAHRVPHAYAHNPPPTHPSTQPPPPRKHPHPPTPTRARAPAGHCRAGAALPGAAGRAGGDVGAAAGGAALHPGPQGDQRQAARAQPGGGLAGRGGEGRGCCVSGGERDGGGQTGGWAANAAPCSLPVNATRKGRKP